MKYVIRSQSIPPKFYNHKTKEWDIRESSNCDFDTQKKAKSIVNILQPKTAANLIVQEESDERK